MEAVAVFTYPSLAEMLQESNPNKEYTAADSRYVRRPLQGLNIKEDVYASIEVPGAELANSSSGKEVVAYTTNFLLQSITESRQEKNQPVLTFGETLFYFFGEQPRQIQVNAILLNADNFEWEVEWWYNYDNFLRGTKLAENNRRVSLRYEGTTIQGYIYACTVGKDSQNPLSSTLSFSMYVTSVSRYTNRGKEAHEDTTVYVPAGRYALQDTENQGIVSNEALILHTKETLDLLRNSQSTSTLDTIKTGISNVINAVQSPAATALTGLQNVVQAALAEPNILTIAASELGVKLTNEGIQAALTKTINSKGAALVGEQEYTKLLYEYLEFPYAAQVKGFGLRRDELTSLGKLPKELIEQSIANSLSDSLGIPVTINRGRQNPIDLSDPEQVTAMLADESNSRAERRNINLQNYGKYVAEAWVYAGVREANSEVYRSLDSNYPQTGPAGSSLTAPLSNSEAMELIKNSQASSDRQ